MLKIIRYIRHKIDSRKNWAMKMDEPLRIKILTKEDNKDSDEDIDYKAAYLHSKEIGRVLTDEELEMFRTVNLKSDKRKLGACKGAFEVPEDIDESNDEIADMFYNSDGE